jgi:hypothetical protein
MAERPALGSGERFRELVEKLKKKKVGKTARGRKMAKARAGKTKKVYNPAALAAWIGRKVHSKEQMTKWAVAGRKRAK